MLRANNDPCLTCERPDCPGVCDRIREGMGEVDTSQAVHTITWHGVTRPVSEWAEILGVSRQTLYRRLESAESTDDAMQATISRQSRGKNLPAGAIEETYIRLSTMHLDYLLYWNKLHENESSAGMVARYGAVRASPTGSPSNPVEQRAIPELSMSDEALYRRGWVACVLCVIERYRQRNKRTKVPIDQLYAKVLEWRAIEGMTLKKISSKLNDERPYDKGDYNPIRLRRYMDVIARDVASEAVKRGLIRGTQK